MNQPDSLKTEASEPALRGLRVLLVEDEADTRGFLSIMLRQEGADVHEAGSVSEAMANLETFDADMVVSDIGMPGEDGYNLIRRVRERENATGSRPVPAVALTAYAGDMHRRRSLREGFQAHLAKPVDPTEIITLLARLAAA